LMELAGAKMPAGFQYDGLSFCKQLVNRNTRVRDWVYCAYNPNWGGRKPAVWVHDRIWKLYADGRFYNIAKDPEELSPIQIDGVTDEGSRAREKLARVIEMYRH